MEKVNLNERCKEIYKLTLQFLTEYCGKKAKKKKNKQILNKEKNNPTKIKTNKQEKNPN
jgi:hypothetical protein